MGSQLAQGNLWGQQPQNWSTIQEPTGINSYKYALQNLGSAKARKLLDAGCGSGIFCGMAIEQGFIVTGLDASDALIVVAKKNIPAASFVVGELEELPFENNSFDVVTGFNSFQYAANMMNAIGEAKRVLKDDGRLIISIWGNKEDCEASSYIAAIGSCLPPPPPGAPGPFALSEDNRLGKILDEAGLAIESTNDMNSDFIYPDTETALKGLMSAGPAARAIEHSGTDKVREVFITAMQPYIQPGGKVIYRNKFRVVIIKRK
jgi:SAM-dependent methyltransferase